MPLWFGPRTTPPPTVNVNVTGPTGGLSAGDLLTLLSSGTAVLGWYPAADGSGGITWTAPSGVGITDHGLLTGLANDDHAQYHNDARGDARYSLLAHTHAFGSLTAVPTTVAGYGITDFDSLGDARWSLLAHTHTFGSLTSVPTTIAGYGITDFDSLGDARWSLLGHTHVYSSLIGIPATFAPSAHTHPTTDVIGLGTLATQSGTFSGTHSGTSSGTNTGDQDLSPYQTIAALSADVRAVTLAGLSTSTAQPIVAGDQLLAALGYLQAQINTTTRATTTADFTSASTSLVNVTPASGPNLALAVAANSVYDFMLTAEWSSSNLSGTCNWTFTAPAAATHTGYRQATRADNSVTNGGVGPNDDTSFGLSSSVVTANARCSVIIHGKLITGANAGTFQFRLASGNAAWTAKIFSGASLRLTKVG